jgi:DNA repair protein RadC
MRTENGQPVQLSFLAPDDVQMLHLMRCFIAEASRIYESRTGRTIDEALTVDSAAIAYDFLRGEMACLEQEQLRTLNLNIKNRILSAPMIYQGTLEHTFVRIAEVFRPAIVANAAALIVAHNHPSGDPTPSPEDVRLTKELVEAGRLLGINVLDHIVIGDERFVSLRERGLGF